MKILLGIIACVALFTSCPQLKTPDTGNMGNIETPGDTETPEDTVQPEVDFSNFVIENLQDLILFRDNVNAGNLEARTATVLLKENITLPQENWEPIGNTQATSFQGIFDGNNKTISGLYHIDWDAYDIGLFGQITKAGSVATEVKNLTINNAYIEAGNQVGLLAGKVTQDVKITNIKTTNSIIEGNSKVGGLIGNNEGGALLDCVNNATVIGQGTDIGGIAGTHGIFQDNQRFKASITNCTNNGSVESVLSSSNKDSRVGGIAGHSIYATRITDCINRGEIKSLGGAVGGIVGEADSTIFTNCHNYANVRGGGHEEIGGIVGVLTNDHGGGYIPYSKVVDSSNTGDITGGYKQIGGIAGRVAAGGRLENVFNTGNITNLGEYTGATGGDTVGGIAGENRGITLAAYNTGKISSTKINKAGRLGGVLGTGFGDAIAVYNTGTVEFASGATEVGGIKGDGAAPVFGAYTIGDFTGTIGSPSSIATFSETVGQKIRSSDDMGNVTEYINLTGVYYIDRTFNLSEGVLGSSIYDGQIPTNPSSAQAIDNVSDLNSKIIDLNNAVQAGIADYNAYVDEYNAGVIADDHIDRIETDYRFVAGPNGPTIEKIN